ncbi:MAG: hypothetical protein ABSH26_17310 [Opitutaceae bacterium]|jgi:hypothetical protein
MVGTAFAGHVLKVPAPGTEVEMDGELAVWKGRPLFRFKTMKDAKMGTRI